VRGTFKEIEVERWGGEQARRLVNSTYRCVDNRLCIDFLRQTGAPSLFGEWLRLRGEASEEWMGMNIKKTARPYVEHRGYYPNRVTFSNPSVAQGRLPRASIFVQARIYDRAYRHRASTARPSNHHPATEAGAAPFARWLHKSGSHSHQAADLSELSPPPPVSR